MIGDLDTHDGACRFLAEHSGCRVLSVDYRLAPGASRSRSRWKTRSRPSPGRTRTPPSSVSTRQRIAVGGDSAGGNLSTALCLQNRDAGNPQPAMQLLLYPVTDAVGGQQSRDTFAEGFLLTREDMEWFEDHYIPDGIDDADPRASMMRADDVSGLPPAYVATAGFDPLRDEGEIYAARMREAGVQVVLQRHPRLIHGFANLTAICPSARTAMLEVAGALRMGLGLATAVSTAVPA